MESYVIFTTEKPHMLSVSCLQTAYHISRCCSAPWTASHFTGVFRLRCRQMRNSVENVDNKQRKQHWRQKETATKRVQMKRTGQCTDVAVCCCFFKSDNRGKLVHAAGAQSRTEVLKFVSLSLISASCHWDVFNKGARFMKFYPCALLKASSTLTDEKQT